MTTRTANADPGEIARFNALASRWWDPAGEMRMLHRMNPARMQFIGAHATLSGAHCLDVGCGGGLLCESLAAAGAQVTGIDLATDSLAVARLHQRESGVADIRYLETTVEALAGVEAGAYDVVTCLEVLEHVPEPRDTVAACSRLARPGGTIFCSTINRSLRAYAVAVLGAEYLTGMLPRGTHDYARFIRPSELAHWARAAGLELKELAGLVPAATASGFAAGASVAVNYIACFVKPGR